MTEAPPLPARLEPHPLIANITFAEGPAFDDRGNLYFVNYFQDGTIGRWSPDGTVGVWAHTGGSAGGIKYDGAGHIVVADSRGERITRFDLLTREMEVLTAEFEGESYKRPNDITFDRAGNIYFTAPLPSVPGQDRLGSVYRINMSDDNEVESVDRVLTEKPVPNGLAVHPARDEFYLALTGTSSVVSYTISGDGSLVDERLVHEFPSSSVDGIAFDEFGRLWVARWLHGSVAVLDVDTGEQLADYPMGVERVTNLAWWDTSLYVTVAGRHSIERLDAGCRGGVIVPEWPRPGQMPPPP